MKPKKFKKAIAALLNDHVNLMRGWFSMSPRSSNLKQAVVLATLHHAHPDGVSEEELHRICKWVDKTFERFLLVGKILNGEINMRFDEGAKNPKIRYTKYGQDIAAHRDDVEQERRNMFG